MTAFHNLASTTFDENDNVMSDAAAAADGAADGGPFEMYWLPLLFLCLGRWLPLLCNAVGYGHWIVYNSRQLPVDED